MIVTPAMLFSAPSVTVPSGATTLALPSSWGYTPAANTHNPTATRTHPHRVLAPTWVNHFSFQPPELVQTARCTIQIGGTEGEKQTRTADSAAGRSWSPPGGPLPLTRSAALTLPTRAAALRHSRSSTERVSGPFLFGQYGTRMNAWGESRDLYWLDHLTNRPPGGRVWLVSADELSRLQLQHAVCATIGRLEPTSIPTGVTPLRLDTSPWTAHSDAAGLKAGIAALQPVGTVVLFHNFHRRLEKFARQSHLDCIALDNAPHPALAALPRLPLGAPGVLRPARPQGRTIRRSQASGALWSRRSLGGNGPSRKAPLGERRRVSCPTHRTKAPHVRGFREVAGAGFEPATFGL
jgi:hypothetical protein